MITYQKLHKSPYQDSKIKTKSVLLALMTNWIVSSDIFVENVNRRIQRGVALTSKITPEF